MRVNYAGEIAAQGLYLGAWIIETDPKLSGFYQHAMEEEYEHLEWCGKCVADFGGRVSFFNPVWFMGSVCLGIVSRTLGSGWALGFVEETEKQVLSHLESHLKLLPVEDTQSRQVVCQMIQDEKSHGEEAKSLGARPLPTWAGAVMRVMGRVLTKASAKI